MTVRTRNSRSIALALMLAACVGLASRAAGEVRYYLPYRRVVSTRVVPFKITNPRITPPRIGFNMRPRAVTAYPFSVRYVAPTTYYRLPMTYYAPRLYAYPYAPYVPAPGYVVPPAWRYDRTSIRIGYVDGHWYGGIRLGW